MQKKTITRTKISEKETVNNGRAVLPAPATPVTPVAPPAPVVKAAKSVPAVKLTPTRDDIARRAYELYLARGKSVGHDLEDWTQAERELLGKEHRNN
jgi:hypothetical protein